MNRIALAALALSAVVSGCTCSSPSGDDGGGLLDDGGSMGSGGGSAGGGTGAGGGGEQLPDGGQCIAAGQSCVTGDNCCAGTCSNSVCTSSTFCRGPGGGCSIDSDCCNANCVSGQCGATACTAQGQACQSGATCCSGVCNANTCAAIAGGSCKVLGETCNLNGECCSTLCRSGRCAKAYYCQPNGDRCSANAECCGAACSVNDGGVGVCLNITGGGGGGCTQEGNPCSGGSNCCSRTCFDPGSGASVCLPAGGCRLTGTSCTGANACCGGGVNPNGSVQCNEGRCDNGQMCNPVGNICGAPVLRDGGSINASQNCCDGMKDVCKVDSSGIPRCYGGFSGNCPTGYTGQAGCCIATGDVCQFRDQCCNGALCLPSDGGGLRCQTQTCTPLGGACTTDETCCTGNSCVVGVCRPPNQGRIDAGVGPDGGELIEFSDGGLPRCAANGGACSFSAQCCSQICTSGRCEAPQVCQSQGGTCTSSADCCSGTTCAINAGSAFGTCQAATCVGPGQTCSAGGGSCCNGLSCLNVDFAACGSMGSCTCTVIIN